MYQSFRMAGSEYHFAQKVNPLTGKYEWIVEHHDEHDYFTGKGLFIANLIRFL